MLDQVEFANKTRFPWRLALKMGKETVGYTLGIWFVVGIVAGVLEWIYGQLGITGDLALLAGLVLITVVHENATDIWAHVLPVLERKLATHRDRLGL